MQAEEIIQIQNENDFEIKTENNSSIEIEGEFVKSAILTHRRKHSKFQLHARRVTFKIIIRIFSYALLHRFVFFYLSENSECNSYSSDPADWTVNDDLITYLLQKGPSFCRNKDDTFVKSAREYVESEEKKKRDVYILILSSAPLANAKRP